MRGKKWIALALAVAIAGTGTGFLAHAMTKKQEVVMTKMAKVSEKEAPSVKEEKKEEETASYPVQTIAPDSKRDIKKTKADMSAEEAAHAAVQKAREVFGELEVKKVIDLDLGRYSAREYIVNGEKVKGRGDYDVRAYSGIILCKGDVAYRFIIDSITGENMYWMEKHTNYMEKGYGKRKHDEEMTERIQNNETKYYGAAKLFFEEHLQQKEQVGSHVDFELLPGGTAGTVKGIQWERHIACVLCRVGNVEYFIRLDPESAEVLGWEMGIVNKIN